MTGVRVEAWRVHDTGLVAVPSRFRRLGGLVRHHRGEGDEWPPRVRLSIAQAQLRVEAADGTEVGSWPIDDVAITRVQAGPPASFVVDVPGGSHLLAAAPPALDGLLSALHP